MRERDYYNKLDVIRVMSCIAVFLYHLNILPGGFLAVCTFFVLTAYLSCLSANKNDKFSLHKYYLGRLKKVYIPLLFVVFISVLAVSLIPDINWISLKPETTSVIFGYNNFWQIGANMDYFARHVSSPFMHFWYIAILLQFEIIFPFIYIIFKTIGDKTHKSVPIIILLFLSIVSAAYFFMNSITDTNIMNVYYNSLSRSFSCIFGITLGFISIYYGNLTIKNKSSDYIFYFYILILCIMFIFVDSQSSLFALSMILASFISCRLISYATIASDNKLNHIQNAIKKMACISYEVYLFQYPVIFIFQYVVMDDYLKKILIVIITIICSLILHFALNNKMKKIGRYVLLALVTVISLFGLYKYIISEDHTEELLALKEQLNKNEEMMMQKQEEYKKAMDEENSKWEEKLKELENGTNNLNDVITNLPIVGVGDSVMLGAVPSLYNTFPHGYFDAKVSRTDYEANAIFRTLLNNGTLGNPVVIHLGTNGQCGNSCRDDMLNTLGDRKIFWITVTNDSDVHVNASIFDYANRHNNNYVIDWASISSGHTEYFAADRIHLTPVGMEAYSKVVYDAIYNNYLDEYNKMKDEEIKKHDDKLKEKMTFYGNDLLLNSSVYLENKFNNAEFIIDKEFSYDKLLDEIKKDSPNYNVILVFDKSFDIDSDRLNELVELLPNNKIYIVKVNNKLNIDNDKIEVIDFSNDIKNYLMVDNIHLNNDGNQKLCDLIEDKLIKKEP